MKRAILIISALLFFTALSVDAQPLGNQGSKGRIVFNYFDDVFMAKIDEDLLEPLAGRIAVREFNHGPHKLQILSRGGYQYSNVVFEMMIFVPGGYEMNLTYRPEGLIIESCRDMSGAVPVLGSSSTQSMSSQSTSADMVPGQPSATTGMANDPTQILLPNAPTSSSTQTPIKMGEINTNSATVTFMSEEGDCEIYLNGKKKATLDIPDIDKLAEKTLTNIEAGTYRVKVVQSKDVWYEGNLVVGRKEDIKVRVEPGTFKVTSRKAMK